MQFIPYSRQYVRWPRLSKRCIGAAVEFPNKLNNMSKPLILKTDCYACFKDFATWVSVTKHGAPSDCGCRRSQIWKLATNVLDKQSRTADVGLSCSFGDGRGVNNPSPLNFNG